MNDIWTKITNLNDTIDPNDMDSPRSSLDSEYFCSECGKYMSKEEVDFHRLTHLLYKLVISVNKLTDKVDDIKVKMS